jgi:hypothetical protein
MEAMNSQILNTGSFSFIATATCTAPYAAITGITLCYGKETAQSKVNVTSILSQQFNRRRQKWIQHL